MCFTSGGTESNNLAIIGVAEANKRSGKHVITTSIEHPSVSATMVYLEEHGYEVTYLPVDAYGVISLDDLKAAIRPDTILVSLMQVNNEIGAVEPIAEAGALIKQCNPQTLFHVDAIQSYGKMRIYPAKMPPYETAFVFMKEDYQDIDVPPWAIKLILDTKALERERTAEHYEY